MKELLEAGVHFGHQTKRWNPKMKEYIFGERNGIYIIDLQKTLKLFKDAMRFVGEMAASGKTVLFVGTKRQAQEAISEEALRCQQFYVNQRWLGGLLTNMTTVQKSIKRLKELDAMAAEGNWDGRAKKEVVRLERERNITGASTYTDRSTAEHAVGAAIAQSQGEIQNWLSQPGRHPNLVLDYDSDVPIGRTMNRGEHQSRVCEHAVVVLKYSGPNHYYVLTSYPECRS